MTTSSTIVPRGAVFRCPICHAEVAMIGSPTANFSPKCCAVAMEHTTSSLRFFACDICGAEVAIVGQGEGNVELTCCASPMRFLDDARF